MIKEKDLKLVEDRKVGRPKKFDKRLAILKIYLFELSKGIGRNFLIEHI